MRYSLSFPKVQSVIPSEMIPVFPGFSASAAADSKALKLISGQYLSLQAIAFALILALR